MALVQTQQSVWDLLKAGGSGTRIYGELQVLLWERQRGKEREREWPRMEARIHSGRVFLHYVQTEGMQCCLRTHRCGLTQESNLHRPKWYWPFRYKKSFGPPSIFSWDSLYTGLLTTEVNWLLRLSRMHFPSLTFLVLLLFGHAWAWPFAFGGEGKGKIATTTTTSCEYLFILLFYWFWHVFHQLPRERCLSL